MKLVMTLLVRDEEDILDDHLRYHFERGVDFVIATDNRSVDSTPDILRGYESAGCLHVIDEPADDYDQRRWVTRMARMAHVRFGADWVMHSDADEFWWPHDGDLASTFGSVRARVGIIYVPRHDFVPIRGDHERFHQRMTWRKAESLNVGGRVLPRKVAHRSRRWIVIEQGNHDVRRAMLRRDRGPAPIEILHFPMRSFDQFENKIVNGGRAYLNNRTEPQQSGLHWRELYRTHQDGGLRAYWDDRSFAADDIARASAAGDIVRDDRLAEYFHGVGDA